MNVAPVFAGDRKNHRLRRAVIRRMRDATDVHTFALQIPDDEIPEDVVADLSGNDGAHAEFCKRCRGVGRAAARVGEKVLRHHQFAGDWEARQRWDEQIGHQTPAQTTSPGAGYELTTFNCIQNAPASEVRGQSEATE